MQLPYISECQVKVFSLVAMMGSQESGPTMSLFSLASTSGNCSASGDGMGVGADAVFMSSAAAQPSWSMMLVNHY